MMGYEQLGQYSSSVSYGILKWSEDREIVHNREQIKYILKSCKEFNNAFKPSPVADSSASSRFLGILRNGFEELWNGSLSGEDLVGGKKGFWVDLNKTGILAAYPESIHRYFNSVTVTGNALEINADIGATSDLISHKFSNYVRNNNKFSRRNDLVFDIGKTVEYFDKKFDYVIGSNALTRISDKERALTNIKKFLEDDGTVVLVEGEAYPANMPFVLNNAFGLLNDWWKNDGFMEGDRWAKLFIENGFEIKDLISIKSDDTIVIGNLFVLKRK